MIASVNQDLMRWKVINFVGFQAGWFGCILGAAWSLGWIGPLLVGLLFLGQLRLFPDAGAELRLAAAAAVTGFLLDSAASAVGLYTFAANPWGLTWLSPPWLVAMWVNFSLTLNLSLSWLLDKPAAAAVLGALGGPLAYLAGERLGAIDFTESTGLVLAALALIWAGAVPFLFRLARREGQ